MLIVSDFFWEAEGRWAIGNGKLVTYTRKSKTNLYFFYYYFLKSGIYFNKDDDIMMSQSKLLT